MKSKHSIRVCNISIHRKFRKSWANFHIKFLSLNISPFRTMQEFWSINKHWYKETRCIWSLYIDIGLLVPCAYNMITVFSKHIISTVWFTINIYRLLSTARGSKIELSWLDLTAINPALIWSWISALTFLHSDSLSLSHFLTQHSRWYNPCSSSTCPLLVSCYQSQGTCVINDFEVQTNFVPEQFSGLWHLAGYNRMMRPVTRLPPRIAKITTRYVKSLYALGEDGRGTIRSSKGIFVE